MAWTEIGVPWKSKWRLVVPLLRGLDSPLRFQAGLEANRSGATMGSQVISARSSDDTLSHSRVKATYPVVKLSTC